MEVLVKAGFHDRRACPVWVQLPLPQGGVPDVRLTDEAGAPVACQLEPSGSGPEDRLWLTWIVRDLPAGDERRYRITPVHGTPDGGAPEEATDHGPGVVLEELPDGQLSVQVDGQHFTTYNFGSDYVRPYFFPLVGPTGTSVVRNWPMVEGVAGETNDHPHHKGLYVAHGDVNGTDNWSEGPDHCTMRHAGFSRLVSGPVYGAFDETVEWLDREARVVVTETRRVTFFNLKDEGARIMDVSLRFSAGSNTVTFGDTKEGGLISIRVASSMDAPTQRRPEGKGQMENAYGGRQEEECWGKRAMWCDYFGPLEGEIVGVTMMDHPTNPRYPTHWHVRAYGLMTANPFGLHDFYDDADTHRGDWTIPAYESRNFLYRVLLHRGSTAEADVRERYHDFVNVPSVELVQTAQAVQPTGEAQQGIPETAEAVPGSSVAPTSEANA
jgi:hypothetical protein